MSRLTSSKPPTGRSGSGEAVRVERSDPYDEWIIIGRIRAPHGVRGELRVEVLTDFPERFQAFKRLYIGDSHTPYDVERARFTPKGVLLKLVGVDFRDKAGLFARSYVALPESELAPLPAGSFHHHQIKGIKVYADDGGFLGTVTEIITTGSNDVYIVRNEDGGEILLPATTEVVRTIDVESQRIVVNLIPGLIPD